MRVHFFVGSRDSIFVSCLERTPTATPESTVHSPQSSHGDGCGMQHLYLLPLLPFELRLLIWEEALSALSAPTTLWAASMKFIGSKPPPPPCRLGLSCKEAWLVVQRCCVRFQSGPPTPRPVWSWADPNKTVIHLNYLAALARFEPETALKFKHVVILAGVSKMGDPPYLRGAM